MIKEGQKVLHVSVLPPKKHKDKWARGSSFKVYIYLQSCT